MNNTTNVDKRTVSTDALETLGTIIGENEGRDAIHLAVIPMQAHYILRPGQNVDEKGSPYEPFIGIVDPFLKERVEPNQWFWLVIYPRMITSLRHVWTHPLLDRVIPKMNVGITDQALLIDKKINDDYFEAHLEKTKIWVKSRVWIENYAKELELSYDRLMDGADQWVKSQDSDYEEDYSYKIYLNYGPLLDGKKTHPHFWEHYEIIREVKLPDNQKINFFRFSRKRI